MGDRPTRPAPARMGAVPSPRSSREIPYADPARALRRGSPATRTPRCCTAPPRTRAGATRSSALEPVPGARRAATAWSTIDGVPVAGAPLDVLRAELARHPQAAVARPAAPSAAGPSATSATRWAATWSACPRPAGRPDGRPGDGADVLRRGGRHRPPSSGAPTIISSGHPETDAGGAPRARAPERLERGRPALRPAPSPLGPPRCPPPRPRIAPTSRARPTSGRAPGDRLHPRRRRLPGQHLAALRAELPAGLAAARPLPPPARGQPGALRRLPQARRPRDRLVVAGALPAPVDGDRVETRPIKGTRPRGRDARRGRGARGRARGQREGPRRERDDRRPPAQRPLAGLPRRQRRGARALRRRALRDGHAPGLDGHRAAAPRPRAGRPARGLLPRRLDHRGAEDPRDGDHRRARGRPAAAPTAAPSATSASTARSTPASSSARSRSAGRRGDLPGGRRRGRRLRRPSRRVRGDPRQGRAP